MKAGIRLGFNANLPVAVSVMAYGSVLGVLAAQKNILWTEMMYMNFFMFAGSAQFLMVDMWQSTLHVLEITIAVFVINLRYALIGASLRDFFTGKSIAHKMAVMHLVADENWAVTMARKKTESVDTWFLLGGGICLLFAWSFGTLLGHSLGAVIKNPEAYALDFAFIAVFTALAFSMWQGKRNILPWIFAALLSILFEKILPGKWYILIGGTGGAFIEALIYKEETD